MRSTFIRKTLFPLFYCLFFAAAQAQQNPVLPFYQADPDINFFAGKYWIYPTGGTRFRAWSSTDLLNWTDEGVIFDLGAQCSWAKVDGWAPDMVYRNGKYYFYYTADAKIGVAVGNTPKGPFTDLGRPLIGSDPFIQDIIDGMVFIDNGQAYLYYGGSSNSRMIVRKLNNDMISFSGDPQDITPPGYTEGPFIFKRNGTYYCMYSNGRWYDHSYNVRYATGPSPLGPWTYQRTVLTTDNFHGGPGHHALLDIGCSNSMLIAYHRYHNKAADRRVCIDRMYFNPDGSIENIKMTNNPVVSGCR